MQSVFNPRRLDIERRVREFAANRDLTLDFTTAQRTLTVRSYSSIPPHGTEIFVTKLPREVFEDELLPLFETAGKVHKFRLMMSPSGISNRGIAFVTYTTEETARNAIDLFNKMEVVPGHRIEVKKSIDNRRLFIGGIPEHKNKDQVWKELKRIGVRGIMDVIMYRSYIDRSRNRGFAFIEFPSHEEASKIRLEFRNALVFGNRVQLDWSMPLNNVDDAVMNRVKKLFIRNLNVLQEPEEFSAVITQALGNDMTVEKVYKCRDYAFVHFVSRRDAQRGLYVLREYFKHSCVEICWAKPAPKKKPESSPPPGSSCSSIGPVETYHSSTPAHNAVNGGPPNATICQNCLSYVNVDWLENTRLLFENLNL